MSKILITGANGTIGKATIKALQAVKHNFVAGVRNIEKSIAFLGLEPNQLVHFDFSKPETFENATEDVDAVFLLTPPLDNNLEALVSPFIDFLKARGINRLVYLGALGLDKNPDLPFHTNIIKKIKRDGFDYTILYPSFFSSNFKNYEFENITQRGITYVVAGEGKVGFVDTDDIGRVVANVLTQEKYIGKEYELTGPELLSYIDAATILSEVLGRPIFYPNPSEEEYTDVLKASGAPDFIAQYMISVYSLIKNNHVNYLTDNIELITGNKPTSLKDVLLRDFRN